MEVCARLCLALSIFAAVLLPIFGLMLVTKSNSLEVPEDTKVPNGISCFICTGLYICTGIASFLYLQRNSGKPGHGNGGDGETPMTYMPSTETEPDRATVRRTASGTPVSGNTSTTIPNVEMRPLLPIATVLPSSS